MKSFDDIMNINVRAAVELTHYCIKHLIETKGLNKNHSLKNIFIFLFKVLL